MIVNQELFICNKYLKWYFSIIENAKNQSRTKKTKYFESHHIIPRSLGGDDLPNNRVLLTAREHYVVHMLLVRFVNKKFVYKMISALARFIGKAQRNSRSYECYKQTMSNFSKGELNTSYGKIWVHKKTDQSILYIPKEDFDETFYVKGLPAQRGGYSGYIWLHKKDLRCAVPPDAVEKLITEGWALGRNVTLSDGHYKKMVNARHTKEKDQLHSEKLTGKITIRKPNEKNMIRVNQNDLQSFLDKGYIIHKGSGMKMKTSSGLPCTINGITYKSQSEASRLSGISYSKIRKMCK